MHDAHPLEGPWLQNHMSVYDDCEAGSLAGAPAMPWSAV